MTYTRSLLQTVSCVCMNTILFIWYIQDTVLLRKQQRLPSLISFHHMHYIIIGTLILKT